MLIRMHKDNNRTDLHELIITIFVSYNGTSNGIEYRIVFDIYNVAYSVGEMRLENRKIMI